MGYPGSNQPRQMPLVSQAVWPCEWTNGFSNVEVTGNRSMRLLVDWWHELTRVASRRNRRRTGALITQKTIKVSREMGGSWKGIRNKEKISLNIMGLIPLGIREGKKEANCQHESLRKWEGKGPSAQWRVGLRKEQEVYLHSRREGRESGLEGGKAGRCIPQHSAPPHCTADQAEL